jgi:hypothetical protein
MTRERALKKIIRARAAKTGERYTTARRHVLATMAVSKKEPIPRERRSPVSDSRIVEKTGHGLDYWFVVLDRFGGPGKGHTALARHLYDEHQVPGWHAQGITTAYERARGVRVVNRGRGWWRAPSRGCPTGSPARRGGRSGSPASIPISRPRSPPP